MLTVTSSRFLLNPSRWTRTAVALAAISLWGCAQVSVSTPSSSATPPVTASATSANAATLAASAPATGASGAASGAALNASSGSNAAANALAARMASAAAGAPPAFADVTKDAKRTDGFLPLWTKDDKVWIEVPAELMNQPFFFSASLANGLGERFFWPGLMSTGQLVSLRKVGNNVQLMARNLKVRAPEGTPLSTALHESYSDSLLASTTAASAAHPQRKSILVDAYALLGGDLTGTQTRLEGSYRLPYTLDRANSSITSTRSSASGTSISVRSHFAIPKLPSTPVMSAGPTPPNPASLPSPPTVVPDPRSLFLTYTYTLAALPKTPMKSRVADPRVGYFVDSFLDLGKDDGKDRRTHLIHRWRLEKKDPAAAVSEPKEPIRIVMDRNIPLKWREAVKAGILEWNKGFERAGFRNAISVEQQADDAAWTTLEGTRVLAVRWFAQEGPGATAVGPSQADPRTGEILRGAAIIPDGWARLSRNRVNDTQPRLQGMEPLAHSNGHLHDEAAHCEYAEHAVEQAAMGLELLSARGLIDPNGPDAERYIGDSLKDVTMHEVGHALGLRHNFKASTGVTAAQLRDPSFTKQRGVSNSVMDYNGLNLALEGEAQTDILMTTLGAYDYWAIEYGYREFAAGQEAAGLAEIAGRSEKDRNLAYGTDEDVMGFDPMVNQRDLGEDPLAYAQRQIKLAKELWSRTLARPLDPNDDLTLYRRNLQRVFGSLSSVIPMATKFVGGAYTHRVLAGANRPLIEPVPAQRQRQALDLVLNEIFTSSSFKFDPKIMSRLGIDQVDRFSNRGVASVEFSVGQAALTVQKSALDALISDGLGARLADAEVKVDNPRTLLSYADVQMRLSQAIWSELRQKGTAREIDTLRRNLQREHVKRLAAGLLRPGTGASADVPAVHRQVAKQLEAELRQSVAQGGWSAMGRAHLEDSMSILGEALKAPLARQGL